MKKIFIFCFLGVATMSADLFGDVEEKQTDEEQVLNEITYQILGREIVSTEENLAEAEFTKQEKAG